MHYSILFRVFCTDRQDERKEWKENDKEKQGEKEKNGRERERDEGERDMDCVTNSVWGPLNIISFHPHIIPWKSTLLSLFCR